MQDINSYALGSHAWFIPEGRAFTSPDAGTVAVDDWPDAAEATWSDYGIGDIEGWEDTKNVETVEPRKPRPGALVRKDIITLFQSLDFKMTTNSLRRLAFELFYGSAVPLTDEEGTFVPLAATPSKGLLKIQRYTHENELVFAADLWVRAEITGGMKGGNGEITKPEFSFKLLDSDLNTMFFGDDSLLS
jgi:hypothetical protein